METNKRPDEDAGTHGQSEDRVSCGTTNCSRREAIGAAACTAITWLLAPTSAGAQVPGTSWTAIGPSNRFKVGAPVRVALAGGKSLIVTRLDAKTLAAVSTYCPHKGCEVKWDSGARKIICPCHGAEFTTVGKVTRGPATTGLARMAALEKNGQIYVDSRGAVASAGQRSKAKEGDRGRRRDDDHDDDRDNDEHGEKERHRRGKDRHRDHDEDDD